MSASELETQINRFKVNEERLNTFVNVDGFYTTSSGVQVPTLLNVSKRIEADAESTINEWQEAINTITVNDGVPALAVFDVSGKTQQEINNNQKDINNYQRNLTEYSVENWALPLNISIGDGVYRNVRELYSVGSEYQRFNSRTELESWLGFNLSTLINVVEEATIDTVIIQKAINELSALYLTMNVAQTLKFKTGGVYYSTGLNHKCGVDIVSDGGSEFKKRPALDITNEGVLTWWRIMVSDGNSFNTAEKCKHRCLIKGIRFNGNMSEMNWTYNTYKQEQGSCLLVSGAGGSNGGSADVRAKYKLQDLDFIDSTSDGLHIVQNTDVYIAGGLSARDCFRGGLVITGGNSIVTGGGMVSSNARFDQEIDSQGFGGSLDAKIYLSGYWQDVGGKQGDFAGGMDFGSVGYGALHLNDFHIHSLPLNVHFAREVNQQPELMLIKNSTFHVGIDNWLNPSKGMMKNVKFILRNDVYPNLSLNFLMNAFGYYQSERTDFIFDTCDFDPIDKTTVSTMGKLIVISQQSETNKARLKFVNCDMSKVKSSNYTFSADNGGAFYLEKNKISSTGFVVAAGTYGGIDLTLGDNELSENTTVYLGAVFSNTGAFSHKIEFLDNCRVKESNNTMLQLYGANGIPAQKIGRRTIVGDAAPLASTDAYSGDVFVLSSKTVGKPYEWVAVHSGVAFGSGAVWQATKWLTGSFTTVNLPVLTAFDVGCQNFDSTLNKIVTWTGSAWV